ncbi:restriction endonuclease subunit S (plasmid) [Acinetobacter haemolyticus]|nr:restriction endonuclease subunit S [Acinetobacter haemolyticus]
MDFKEYPSYKNSGVEWLGDVPEHWQQKPIWSLFKRIKRTNFPTERLLSVYRDYGVIPKDSRDDNHNRASEDLTPYQLVCANDLVINKMKAWQGSIAISELRGIVSPAYYIYQPKAKYHSKYIHFLIRSAYYIQSYKNYSKGIRVNQWDLESEAFTHIDLLLPSLDEQQKIVAFLDTETTRIDNLIAKQEKLIELLEEQRKSIISHAVTKGLNPNAPMKDGGVEWLGEVPEHWMTPSSKHLLEIPITDGPHETPNFVDDGVPFISAEAISKGKIDFDKKRGYITPELNAIYSKKYSPKIEDIYMVKSGATTGKVAMVETTEEFNIWSPLAVFRCNKNKVLPKFLLAVFNSSHFYDALVLNWSYGTQQNIGMGVLSNIEIPCPPLKEQAEIIQHLDAQNTKFDKLISTQSQLIEKLKEYRSSIISHAVTGKIDVREFSA